MREGTSKIVQRLDYSQPDYWIRTVDLSFDLDPQKTIVTSRMELERNTAGENQPALRLDGEDLNLLRVLANGESVSFRHEDGQLVIDTPPTVQVGERFTLEIRNTISPEKNTQLSGLYTSGGGFFTQCEAEGFRRITYFLDRPDVMAVFTVTLRANKTQYPVLLSNGNRVEEGDLEAGRHYAKWHDPFPKPSYLFALVAADLVARQQHVRTRSGKDHLLQVYVRRGDLDKTEHAMNSLVASLIWDEHRFKLPLDLERFMIVAVGDFNMGAMENKGLNIFNTKYVLATPATATDVDFFNIESVVAHEYFHNWTGNRITCRDWFQLSLKEGLTVFRDQEFSMDMAGSDSGRAVCRIGDVRTLREAQFPEDAGPMAHPVRPDQYQAIDNFYTATVYNKGAEVVRMMQTLVGREGFTKGMGLYFERHDGQAVTCDDFAQAIADANPDSELAKRLDTFKRWYAQAGTPRLVARGEYDAASQRYSLKLSQHCAPTAGQAHKDPFLIPVSMGLIGRHSGQALELRVQGEAQSRGTSTVLVLDQAEQTVVFEGVTEEPVPSLMRGFSAPVALDDGLNAGDLLVLLQHDRDPFNRWEASQRLMLDRLLPAIQAGAEPELDEALLQALRSVLNSSELDAAFKELALTVPSQTYLYEQLKTINPAHVHRARESFKLQLAQKLRGDWELAFENHQLHQAYKPDAHQSGCRALANLALQMLVLDATQRGDRVWPGRAYQRVKDAHNMTDRIGALSALVSAHAELADAALSHFHSLFKDEALVIDKWFSVQAAAPERGNRVFDRVRALLQHPDYSAKNPNRARSLVFAYTMSNLAGFHREDAGGYVFWADRVIEFDAINPQLAARLARAMDSWQRLAEPWRSAAQEALKRVAARSELSADVREIVTRALQGH